LDSDAFYYIFIALFGKIVVFIKKVLLSIYILISFNGAVLSQSCLPEGISFETQEQIDNFQINYPGCSEIEGTVYISGGEISNLNGLSILTVIQGSLFISYNDALTSLTGLENLNSIGGALKIENSEALINLSGIGNLRNIGGSLEIRSNNSLTKLNSLAYLLSINGDLKITNNDVLTSLTGIQYIDPGSISNLYIWGNEVLSSCEVQSVCHYLYEPPGIVEIYDNTIGCNNQDEVFEACIVSIDKILPYQVSIFPNPATRQVTVS